MANWYDKLKEKFSETGDDFEKMETTLTKEELKREFYDWYAGINGKPFTAWGENYVYFPVKYNDAEWVGCAPRNPCDEVTYHVGAG
jgi:hypothetical protein